MLAPDLLIFGDFKPMKTKAFMYFIYNKTVGYVVGRKLCLKLRLAAGFSVILELEKL